MTVPIDHWAVCRPSITPWHYQPQPLLLNDSKGRGRFKGTIVGGSSVANKLWRAVIGDSTIFISPFFQSRDIKESVLPFYKVLLCGEGISLPSDDGEPIVGFFATRVAFGKDAQIAGKKAKTMLLNEWECEGWRARNQGLGLVLNIQECWKVTFLNAMLKGASGFTFYK